MGVDANINVRDLDYAADTLKSVNLKSLEKALAKGIEGEVRFDSGSKALYATDASNYRQVPLGVVIPKTKKDVINTVRICREHGAPLLSRGGGTSLAGQTCNVAVILDMSKYYNKILEINFDEKFARVEPGLVLDELRKRAEEKHLTFGPDPATHNRCTLGGMMGNNSCGAHALMAGKTVDNVIELEVLTYDGTILKVGETSGATFLEKIKKGGREAEIYSSLKTLLDQNAKLIREKYPDIPRRVSGYNLDSLLPENNFNVAKALIGSESTCVVILEAKLKLVYSPPGRTLIVLGYDDIYAAADHVMEILKSEPIALEALDDILAENMKRKHLHVEDLEYLPKGHAWLLVEFGGKDKDESDAKAFALQAILAKHPNKPTMKIYDDKEKEKRVWEARESGLGATARIPGEADTWPGWEDSAVHPRNLGSYLRELQKLYKKYDYKAALYGHFGQGCLHTRINFDLLTEKGISKFRAFLEESSSLVIRFGGSLSGEHGDGQARAELLPKMYGPELINAFIEFKRIWDPAWQMNPGKIVKAYRLDENLRLGTKYSPQKVKTFFSFTSDDGNFGRVTTRCVGVGACRRHEGGVMCPSYMATREEKHSTRGRARLLFEMLTGDVLKNGWRNKEVKEALDLCLACKGCKKECPVNVDMASYKAEFLAHYYKGRLRPRNAYAMGLIGLWAPLVAPLARIANFFTHVAGLSRLAKFFANIAPQRVIPPFAHEHFRKWFSTHTAVHPAGQKVILWADTFNTYFHPQIAIAAVEVLEDAGFNVILQKEKLCCGRPLYDFGMLTLAKKWLQQILVSLKTEIEAGVPIIGLEPSCVAVFRDELGELFPNDQDAKRLKKQFYILSEFLEEVKYEPPMLRKKIIVQGHCHHKSVLKMKAEESLFKKMGLDYELLESGCCGMAGSFGFEKEHYDVSVKIGEQSLLPKIRQADRETLIVTNGFSCHEQISQGTGRKVLHLAELIQIAIRERGLSPYSNRKERIDKVMEL